MRRVSIVIAVCFALGLGISLFGQGRDLDAIMKEIGPLWTMGLGQRGASPLDSATPDTAKIAADATKLQALFKEAEDQFTKMKMAEPAGFAKNISEAAGNLAKEAKTGKIADAKAAKTAIGQCKGCHDKYRESDGAGGFKLKMQ
jgi:cytochrome c556